LTNASFLLILLILPTEGGRKEEGVTPVYTEKTIVKCESGLHNKQATYFIQKANEFRASIWIEADDRKINAKSLLGVLSMGITTGTEISLVAEGADEEAAVKSLSAMLMKDIY